MSTWHRYVFSLSQSPGSSSAREASCCRQPRSRHQLRSIMHDQTPIGNSNPGSCDFSQFPFPLFFFRPRLAPPRQTVPVSTSSVTQLTRAPGVCRSRAVRSITVFSLNIWGRPLVEHSECAPPKSVSAMPRPLKNIHLLHGRAMLPASVLSGGRWSCIILSLTFQLRLAGQ